MLGIARMVTCTLQQALLKQAYCTHTVAYC